MIDWCKSLGSNGFFFSAAGKTEFLLRVLFVQAFDELNDHNDERLFEAIFALNGCNHGHRSISTWEKKALFGCFRASIQ